MYILSKFPKKVKKMKSTSEMITDFVMFLAIAAFIVIVCIVYMKVLKPQKIEAEPELVVTPIEQEKEVHKARPVFLEEVVEKHKAILSDDEIMAQVVHEEAKGERLLGQVLVAYTILNRCDYYGETVETVVKKPSQYCYNPETKPNASCYRAVVIAKLIRDFIPDLIPDTMMWFSNTGYHTDCGVPYMQVGKHYFNYLPESEETE